MIVNKNIINEILDSHKSPVYATKASLEEAAILFDKEIPILNSNELNRGLKVYTNTLIEIIRSELLSTGETNERK